MHWGSSVIFSAILFCTAAVADDNLGATPSRDGRITYLPLPHSITSPAPDIQVATHDTTLKAIFNNIDWKFPNAAYWCCGGIIVTGPNAKGATQTDWPAQEFWPSRDATATEIDVAANVVSGTSTITVGLYAEAGCSGSIPALRWPSRLPGEHATS